MSNKISFPLWFVVIMNMNIIVGAGVFVNAAPLAQYAGSLSFLSYLAVACITLPLVLVVAQLSKIYAAAEGGLYTYSKEGIAPWAGNLSAMAYFIGKTASITVLLTATTNFLYDIFPTLNALPKLYCKILFLIFIALLNTLGIKIGGKLQVGFMLFKLIPLILVILLGIFFFNISYFQYENVTFTGFTSSIPQALYALMGFEACCLIGHTINSAKKTISKAVVISFLLVAVIDMLFQGSIFGVLGTSLATIQNPIGNFFITILGGSQVLQTILPKILSGFVVLSILGAAYGMVFVNNWNLFIIAKEKLSQNNKPLLTKLNTSGVPLTCLLIQSLLILLWLAIDTNIIFLSKAAVLGILTSYTLSAIALILSYKKKKQEITLPKFVVILSLISCLYIGINCIKDLVAAIKNIV